MFPLALFTPATPEPITVTTIQSILDTVTTQFSVSNIVAMIAGILGVTVAFVFLWWAVRKGFKAIVAAATKGKPRI